MSLCLPACSWAADGDVFTTKTVEGIDMTFKVISETDKMCQVGDCVNESDWSSYSPRAIDTKITGTVTIPTEANGYRVTVIGIHAFSGCSFDAVVIPGGLKLIDINAFGSCYNLKTITFQGSVETIGRQAFSFCHGWSSATLKSVHLPEGLRHIEWGAFYSCMQLSEVTFPSTLETIDENAFYQCPLEMPLTLPEGLWYIGRYAFDGKKIPSIYIPSSVTYIGDDFVQAGISYIDSITVSPQNPVYDSRNNCNAVIHTATNTLVKGCPKTVIPSSVKAIGNGAFIGQTLSSVTFPQGLERIGDYAFVACNNLTSVVIPEGVTYLGCAAFAQCSNLTSISIPSTIERTGDSGDGYSINVFGYTPWEENLPSGLNYIGRVAYKYVGDMPTNTTITLRKGTTAIENYCFSRCKNLVAITLPEGLIEIGVGALSGCESLISLQLPSSLRAIKGSAFSSCTGLTSLVIPDGVTTVGGYVFADCSNLATLSVPQSVTQIDSDGFGREGMPWYDALPDGPVYLGQVFYGYKGTEPASLTIAPGTKGIAGNALNYKYGLKSLYLPDGLTNIMTTFGLRVEELVLPASIQEIRGFSSDALKALYVLSEEPFKAGFSVNNYTNTTLYVPVGAAERYAHHPSWYRFQNIVECDMDELTNIEAVPANETSRSASLFTGYYSLDGLRHETLRHGLNIVRMANGSSRKVVVP